MNYELAKQLKEAGLMGHGSIICEHGEQEIFPPDPCGCYDNGDTVRIPTLEELIEALPKGDGIELWEETGGWKAVISYPELVMERGKTPLEAVAKLYIALNKKK